MEQDNKKIEKFLNYAEDPKLAIFDEILEISENIDELSDVFETIDLSQLDYIQGEKGEKGDKGDQGEKGDKGDKGEDGKDGKDGINGIDGLDGIDGVDGKDGKNGLDGKDGSPDTPEEIVKKLESLNGTKRLKATAIQGIEDFVKLGKDGYPKNLPQPAASLTYKLNGSQVGRGNILNIVSSGATASTDGDTTTYNIPGGGGPFSNITGTPTEVAYFDAAGNGTSDSMFTRDSVTKESIFGFETYATGNVNDGSSQEVLWRADNLGSIGNSISLVFNGTDDTDTALANWNAANPSNTASVVGGTGNFVPPAGTAQFGGGGTSGYQNQLSLLGQGYQASTSLYTDGGTLFTSNGLVNFGQGMNPFMSAFDFAGSSTIMQMTTTDFDLSTSNGSTYSTFLELNNVRASLIYESTANGDSGIRAKDSQLEFYNKGIQTNWPTTAGTTGQVLTKIAANQLGWSTPGTTTALTQNYIGYGNASNILTGNSNFTYTPATRRFNLTGTNSTFYVRDDQKKIYGTASSGLGEDYTLSIDGTSGHAQFEAFNGSSLYNYVGTNSIATYIQSQDGSNSTAFQTIATSAIATATNGTNTMTMNVSPKHYQVTGSVNGVGITVDDSNKTLAVAKSIIRGDTLHNSAVAQGDATQQDIRSGTYTPTLTGVTNVSSTTSYQAQWSRVGNVVTVSGKIGVEPTANNTSTRVRISLPVASNFTTEQQCAGSGSNVDTTSTAHSARVVADTTNNEAEFGYYETHGTSSEDMTFQFTYLVI